MDRFILPFLLRIFFGSRKLTRSQVFDLNVQAAAIIDRQDEESRKAVESHDEADETDPFDRMIEMEVDVLAFNPVSKTIRRRPMQS